jgi:ADP-heptose:LPS heptosyltransferase
MRLLTFFEPVSGGQELEPDTAYWVEGQQVAFYAAKTDGNVRVDGVEFQPFDSTYNHSKANILVTRAGGAGDILFCFPILQEIKRRWPDCKLHFACHSSYHFVANNCPAVDVVLNFPLKVADVPEYAKVLNLEGAVENSNGFHAVDAMFWKAGIPLPSSEQISKDLIYVPNKDQVPLMGTRWPKKQGVKRIGYQWRASSPVRSYPHKNSCLLVTMLLRDGYEVVLLGEPDSIAIADKNPNLINLSESGLSWEESVSFLKTCDLIIGPDSSSIHFAGAMNIPALGLYGPFKWKYRTSYFKSVWCFQAVGECAPCFHHSNNKNGLLPYDKPCSKTLECEVLRTIDPERVLNKVKTIL